MTTFRKRQGVFVLWMAGIASLVGLESGGVAWGEEAFGLDFLFSLRPCPNESSIRTRFPLFPPALVRMRPLFGLDFFFSLSSCPKETFIRTGFLLLP